MDSEIKEIHVEKDDKSRRIMYLAKEMLISRDRLNLVAGSLSAPTGAQAAEALVRIGYVTYENVRTETVSNNNRRKIRFIITLKKSKDFEKLYKENEENKKKMEAEKTASK